MNYRIATVAFFPLTALCALALLAPKLTVARPVSEMKVEVDDRAALTREKTAEFSGNKLALFVRSGKISIVAGNSDKLKIRVIRTVQATGERAARSILDLVSERLEQVDGKVIIEDRLPNNLEYQWPKEAHITTRLEVIIEAPAGVHVESTSVAVPTTLIGPIGSVAIASDAGMIILDHQSGVSGTIRSGSGDVLLGGTLGDLTVNVAAGSIRAHSIEASRAHHLALTTGSGSIHASFQSVPTEELKLTASTGAVSLSLPKDVARGTVQLASTIGSVRSELPLVAIATNTLAQINGNDPGHTLSGTLGTEALASPKISATSSVGRVTLKGI
jgi:hypothetical protein